MLAEKNHSRNYADFLFVYPVISRRSRGLSIGINLNPDKVCNFDCVYCQVDRQVPPRVLSVDLVRLGRELVEIFRRVRVGSLAQEPRFSSATSLATEIKDVSFSGNGEPTIVHNFAECVQLVADVKREAGLSQTKMVLITNASGLDKPEVKRGLHIMDSNCGEVWGKLDAGSEAYFRAVNQTSTRFDRILKNLLETARARPVVIQTLFLKLRGEPPPVAEVIEYCRRLTEIVSGGGLIKEVHVYTVARPTPELFATKLASAELESIASTIRARTGLTVFTFG